MINRFNVRIKRVLFLFVLTFFISACATHPQPRYVPFNEADFLPYAGIGNCKIVGQAFLKTRGGEVKFGAGNEVVLAPVTPYTQETQDRAIIKGEYLAPHDPRYMKFRRTTIADGNGNFEFENIPAGDYFVSCIIVWEVPGRFGPKSTGGVASARVTAKPGETVRIIVTR